MLSMNRSRMGTLFQDENASHDILAPPPKEQRGKTGGRKALGSLQSSANRNIDGRKAPSSLPAEKHNIQNQQKGAGKQTSVARKPRRPLANITNASSQHKKASEPDAAKPESGKPTVTTGKTSTFLTRTPLKSRDQDVWDDTAPERLAGPTWAEQEVAAAQKQEEQLQAKVAQLVQQFKRSDDLDIASDVSRDDVAAFEDFDGLTAALECDPFAVHGSRPTADWFDTSCEDLLPFDQDIDDLRFD